MKKMLDKLVEAQKVRQNDGEPFRRWFTSDYFDLFVWQEENGEIASFQLCYNKNRNEHVLTWQKDSGFQHLSVDDGETPGHHKMTPILMPDSEFAAFPIAERFERESREIEKLVAEFVYQKIVSYPAEPKPS
jgi:hypothetical protein